MFQFKNLLTKSPLASQYLANELTIFAPSDTAMEKYTGQQDDQFLLNHMGKFLTVSSHKWSIDKVPKNVSSAREAILYSWNGTQISLYQSQSFFAWGSDTAMHSLTWGAGYKKRMARGICTQTLLADWKCLIQTVVSSSQKGLLFEDDFQKGKKRWIDWVLTLLSTTTRGERVPPFSPPYSL